MSIITLRLTEDAIEFLRKSSVFLIDDEEAEEIGQEFITLCQISIDTTREDEKAKKVEKIVSKLIQTRKAAVAINDYPMLDKYIWELDRLIYEEGERGGDRGLLREIEALISKNEYDEIFDTFVKRSAVEFRNNLEQYLDQLDKKES